jgi:hypothetical protein
MVVGMMWFSEATYLYVLENGFKIVNSNNNPHVDIFNSFGVFCSFIPFHKAYHVPWIAVLDIQTATTLSCQNIIEVDVKQHILTVP